MIFAICLISDQHYHILHLHCSASWRSWWYCLLDPRVQAVKEEGMGNLEADFSLCESSKTSGLSRDAGWGHWMSLGPGRGFSLRCRWNSSILSSEFRWRLVGWEVKGSMFHIVPGNAMYKQFNDAVFAPDVSIMKI